MQARVGQIMLPRSVNSEAFHDIRALMVLPDTDSSETKGLWLALPINTLPVNCSPTLNNLSDPSSPLQGAYVWRLAWNTTKPTTKSAGPKLYPSQAGFITHLPSAMNGSATSHRSCVIPPVAV